MAPNQTEEKRKLLLPRDTRAQADTSARGTGWSARCCPSSRLLSGPPADSVNDTRVCKRDTQAAAPDGTQLRNRHVQTPGHPPDGPLPRCPHGRPRVPTPGAASHPVRVCVHAFPMPSRSHAHVHGHKLSSVGMRSLRHHFLGTFLILQPRTPVGNSCKSTADSSVFSWVTAAPLGRRVSLRVGGASPVLSVPMDVPLQLCAGPAKAAAMHLVRGEWRGCGATVLVGPSQGLRERTLLRGLGFCFLQPLWPSSSRTRCLPVALSASSSWSGGGALPPLSPSPPLSCPSDC